LLQTSDAFIKLNMDAGLHYSAIMNLSTEVLKRMTDLSDRFEAIERFQIEQKKLIHENKETINALTSSVKILDDLISTVWREYVGNEYDNHSTPDDTDTASNKEGWITRFVKSKCARPKASYVDAINSTTLSTPTFIRKGNLLQLPCYF
jgi:hypothetical protein